jgi:type VI secretion system secreted protein Hcp
MAVDYFLQLAGVEGESADARHKGWIDVQSWSWGEAQSAPAAGGGAGAGGRVSMQDLHFVTAMSKASPRLLLACASGERFKEARLVAARAGAKEPLEFLVWTFSDVLVTSYQTGGSEGGDPLPMDQVSLGFTRLRVEYRAQRADGTLDPPVAAGWDVKTNTKV